MAQLLALPPLERDLVLWIQRQTACTAEAAQAFLGQDEVTTLEMLQTLEQRSYLVSQLSAEGVSTYQAGLISMRQRRLGLAGPSATPSPFKQWTQSLE